MPGFGLAKKSAEVFEQNPKVEGLILDKHGIFTFGSDAREAYERMIEFVTLAENRLQKNRKAVRGCENSAADRARDRRRADPARRLRAARRQWRRRTQTPDPGIPHQRRHHELRERQGRRALRPRRRAHARSRAAHQAVAADRAGAAGGPSSKTSSRPRKGPRGKFIADYKAYFERNKTRTKGAMLDPAPRVVLVPGLGLFGMGTSAKDARIAADIAEAAVEGISDAEAIGRFTSVGEADIFDLEYWPMELAKLGARKALPLEGQVAVITGAGGAIGAATAKVFAAAGAEVALLDIDLKAATEKAKAIGGSALAIAMRRDRRRVRCTEAFEQVVAAFGGVDIAISNAGGAWQGKIGEVDEATLRESFELNFFAHQKVAQAAVKIMLAQGTGGCLLFNVSKQAVNPGANFGPYGLPKAATLFLVRQYALDYGADGIRANAVNADRIRSGILTDDFIKERSKARGVSAQDYMSGNLLGREVTAQDVAQAFLAQALALKTTADVTTVDGGNIAAALR